MERAALSAPFASPSTMLYSPRARASGAGPLRSPTSSTFTAIHLGPWAKLITSQGRSERLVLSASGQTQSGGGAKDPAFVAGLDNFGDGRGRRRRGVLNGPEWRNDHEKQEF